MRSSHRIPIGSDKAPQRGSHRWPGSHGWAAPKPGTRRVKRRGAVGRIERRRPNDPLPTVDPSTSRIMAPNPKARRQAHAERSISQTFVFVNAFTLAKWALQHPARTRASTRGCGLPAGQMEHATPSWLAQSTCARQQHPFDTLREPHSMGPGVTVSFELGLACRFPWFGQSRVRSRFVAQGTC